MSIEETEPRRKSSFTRNDSNPPLILRACSTPPFYQIVDASDWLRRVDAFEEGLASGSSELATSSLDPETASPTSIDNISLLQRDFELIRAYRNGRLGTVGRAKALEELRTVLAAMDKMQLQGLILSLFLGSSELERSAARFRIRLASHRIRSKRISKNRRASAGKSQRVRLSREAQPLISRKWQSEIEKNGWKSSSEIPAKRRTEFAKQLHGKMSGKKEWPYTDSEPVVRKLRSLERLIFLELNA